MNHRHLAQIVGATDAFLKQIPSLSPRVLSFLSQNKWSPNMAGPPDKTMTDDKDKMPANEFEFKGIITSREDEVCTQNTVWCSTVDGVRLCHLGDLGCSLEANQVALIGDVDVLMIPVGDGKPTLSIENAQRLVEQIKPRIVIPMHYKVPGKCEWNDIQPLDSLLVNRETVKPLFSSEATFSKDHLLDSTEIVVLEPSN